MQQLLILHTKLNIYDQIKMRSDFYFFLSLQLIAPKNNDIVYKTACAHNCDNSIIVSLERTVHVITMKRMNISIGTI